MPTTAEPRARVSILLSIAHVIARWAEARGRRAPDLPSATPTDLYAWVPLRSYLSYFEACALALDDPLLGLKVSRTFSPDELGPIGFLFAASPSIDDACQHLCAFLNAWQEDTEAVWTRSKRHSMWSYRIGSSQLRGLRRQDALFTIGVMVHWLQMKLGSHWRPTEVHFEHPADVHRETISDWFGCVVHFGQPANRVIFDRNDAEQRSSTSRVAGFMPFMQRHLSDLLVESRDRDHDLVERARREVERCLGNRPIRVGAIAAALGVSPRTLQRRLAADDLSLRLLVRAARTQRLADLRANGAPPLGEIAQRLGYADIATTSRALKQIAKS